MFYSTWIQNTYLRHDAMTWVSRHMSRGMAINYLFLTAGAPRQIQVKCNKIYSIYSHIKTNNAQTAVIRANLR